ncbi:MAG: hypothetical protein LBE62_10590 [Azonexus sp.]|jgi:hypothetical protein|nr:hypothetical protein [Azonexus sp.]
MKRRILTVLPLFSQAGDIKAAARGVGRVLTRRFNLPVQNQYLMLDGGSRPALREGNGVG